MGRRPVTPDYLPVIGRAPRHPRVIFAFGHGHSGYNLSPATGRLVGEIAAGRTPNIDIGPYRRTGLTAPASYQHRSIR